MAKKQPKEEVVEVMDNVDETVVLDIPVEEEVKKTEAPKIKVLSRYRVEQVGSDGYVYERIKLPDSYAGQKGVKEFVASNGAITYYVEKLV